MHKIHILKCIFFFNKSTGTVGAHTNAANSAGIFEANACQTRTSYYTDLSNYSSCSNWLERRVRVVNVVSWFYSRNFCYFLILSVQGYGDYYLQ